MIQTLEVSGIRGGLYSLTAFQFLLSLSQFKVKLRRSEICMNTLNNMNFIDVLE